MCVSVCPSVCLCVFTPLRAVHVPTLHVPTPAVVPVHPVPRVPVPCPPPQHPPAAVGIDGSAGSPKGTPQGVSQPPAPTSPCPLTLGDTGDTLARPRTGAEQTGHSWGRGCSVGSRDPTLASARTCPCLSPNTPNHLMGSHLQALWDEHP